ncbi:hypothetical protein Tco_1256131 [Tanacetum coccineum]
MLVDALLQQEVEGHGEQTDRFGGRISDQGGQGGGRGNRVNGCIDKVLDFATVIAQQLQGLLPTIIGQVGNDRNRCSYKDFMACKPKEFDGKGGVVAYIRWVEKMEAVQDISGCGDNQKVKYSPGSLTGRALTWWNSEVRTKGREAARLEIEFWNHAMVVAGHSAYTDQFHELATSVAWWQQLSCTIQSAILKARVLTDEADRNGSLKRSGERRRDDGESSKEGNVKHDNKRARTGKMFAIITNPVRKDYMGSTPKCINYNFHHNPETPYRACMNCNRLGHFARDYRAGPRMVKPLNARNLGGQGRRNNGNPARGRAFVMGAEVAHQDPNIVTSTFSLNKHYARMLFDSGADYSFFSTTFVPLLDIETNSLGFSYEIEIANGN